IPDRARTTVYIGDGLSDVCVVRRAGRVFAKNILRDYCVNHGIAHEPFTTLADVTLSLFNGIQPEPPGRSSL
ncbi:MAG: hypothetical protein ACRD43_08655, partial [Pyrinomonadaceae bacterium]